MSIFRRQQRFFPLFCWQRRSQRLVDEQSNVMLCSARRVMSGCSECDANWLAGWCRVLALVMDELVQTETDYVVALNYVVDHYMPQIQLDSVPQPLRGKRTVVFGNLQNIAQFHTDRFLADISAACRLSAFQLGATFLRHVRTTPTLGHHSLNHSLRTS